MYKCITNIVNYQMFQLLGKHSIFSLVPRIKETKNSKIRFELYKVGQPFSCRFIDLVK